MVKPLDPAVDPPEAAGFRLLGKLGTGGFGTVYLGRPVGEGRGLETLGAVKLLKPEFAEDTQHLQRFHQESKALDRCRGARIPELLVFDFGSGRRPTLATRFIPGLSLYQIIASHGGALPRDTAHAVAAELIAILNTAHGKGLLHRDLHPGNVLLTPDGPWIIDFGLTRIRGQRVTVSLDTVIGHPHFCAPEQVLGLSRTTAATDVFGIGGIVLHALTGHPPYTGESDARAMLMRRVSGAAPDLSRLPDDPTGRIVRACLAEDPADRPTLDEVADCFGEPGTLRLPEGVNRTLADHRSELSRFLGEAGNAADLTVPFRPGRRSWRVDVGEWPHRAVATEHGHVVVADGDGVRWLDAATGEQDDLLGEFTAPVDLHAEGSLLLVCDAGGRLESWDTRNRAPWWSVPAGGLSGIKVLLRGQSVFLGDANGCLHHFDAVTRRVWWRTGPLTDAEEGPVEPVAADGRQVYLSATGGRELLAVDDEDGGIRWKRPVRLPAALLAAPLALNDALVVADAVGGLRRLAAGDGSTRWETDLGAPVVTPPVRLGDRVVVGDTAGMVHCVAARTGEVLWRIEHAEGEELFALCTDGSVIYAGGWNGRLQLIDGTDGASLQSFDLGGQILAVTYAPGSRTVYAAASHGALHAVPTAAGVEGPGL
ncbi:serine/threonine-protein kinase [Streptomyces sp. NPDC005301]|uniref:serine/threonine-protein kinase n=1 Tax=Streptomyces sp. NPDC005301 TaxID=3156874 RepID=UPI0033BB16D9